MRAKKCVIQSLRQSLSKEHHSTLSFLCPAVFRPLPFRPSAGQKRCFSSFYKRATEAEIGAERQVIVNSIEPYAPTGRSLPISCPGCGALSQTVEAEKAGFYDKKRLAVKRYLGRSENTVHNEQTIFSEAIRSADRGMLRQLGLTRAANDTVLTNATTVETPVCDRCHNLTYHHHGSPIHHPSIDAISATIAESPYKDNHVYHVLDAADFPMSLIPRLQEHLHFSRLRTQNRRSRSHRYMRGGTAEMSFIINRSDLLAPRKEIVDKMMPYLNDVLRNALGRMGKNVRLGQVRCVSAMRGWWTKDIKQAIHKRGGASWMVGKVNVGKSSLFEVVFPKGRGGQPIDADQLRREADPSLTVSSTQQSPPELDDFFNTNSLLPPAPKETLYPPMPVISAQPGTTASPIRLLFGNGKGELIDLPGTARATLEDFVQPSVRRKLVLQSRVAAERIALSHKQSLLIDGLIRIVPKTPELVFLTHSFVPLEAHRTATNKLAEIDSGERAHPLVSTMIADGESIAAAGGLKSAGTFQLKWDVTGTYSGPITRKDAVGLKPESLPWITFAADILIEGCGWVEIHAQVRKRKWYAQEAVVEQVEAADAGLSDMPADALSDLQSASAVRAAKPPPVPTVRAEKFPEVEVFSPTGGSIGVRKPMCAYAVSGPRPKPGRAKMSRPRQSMRTVKKQRAAMKRGDAD